MKALILNSGTGSRMGDLTKQSHKSMLKVSNNTPLIGYQLNLLKQNGIYDIVITTGHNEHVLKSFVNENYPDLNIKFVYNPEYLNTNYIYSIFLSLNYLNQDLLMFHGDLYFEDDILKSILNKKESHVVIDSQLELPDKDFKARLKKSLVVNIGIDTFGDDCVACQPMYKLNLSDWKKWATAIEEFCENNKVDVYAENALNEVLKEIELLPFDIKGKLCMEIDNLEDFQKLKSNLAKEV